MDTVTMMLLTLAYISGLGIIIYVLMLEIRWRRKIRNYKKILHFVRYWNGKK